MGNKGRILALDRDPKRLMRLQGNANLTGSDIIVAQCRDFLQTDPYSPEFSAVQGILLDPSCSGSGTVGSNRSSSHKASFLSMLSIYLEAHVCIKA